MDVISLQSGSSGNCYFVEAGNVRLLIDAGISGRQAHMRLAAHHRDIFQIDALLISHDHRDHSQCMGVYHRKFGMPVFATQKTLAATERWCRIGPVKQLHHFDPGDSLDFGSSEDSVQVHSVPTPHDGADGVVFIIEHRQRRLGILTDLGHVFDGLDEVLASLDAVVIESNYDPDLLADGPYPEKIKRRIAGPGGHLSNFEAAELLKVVSDSGRLQWACLGHLSNENNHPKLALKTHRAFVRDQLPVYVASRFTASNVFTV